MDKRFALGRSVQFDMTMSRFTLQKQASNFGRISRAAGFSVFELVAFVILASIIYAGAVNRFSQFPGQAERANFLAVSTTLQSAINTEMLFGLGVGRIDSPQRLVGANPMDLMLEPPSNYLGAFSQLNTANLNRRVWYFDLSTRELVYLVNDTDGVFLIINGSAVPTDEIRFRIQATYSMHEVGSGIPVQALVNNGAQVAGQQQRFDGIALRPTVPYTWNQVNPEELIEQAVAQN